MTIKPTFAAIVAACLLVLFVAPAANAQEKSEQSQDTKTEKTSKKTSDKKSDKPAKPKPVVVTVAAGDTLEKIAAAHDTTYVVLFNANPGITNPDLIDVGDKIRIPTSDEELPDRFGKLAAQPATAATTTTTTATTEYTPVYSQTYTPGAQAVYATDSAGNTYFKGYCTWYAKERRPDLPNQLGNGGQWVASAAAQGYATGSSPRVGAIAETAGHVAYVEAVNPDGTVVLSDMNGRAGFGNVGSYTANAGNYQYIY